MIIDLATSAPKYWPGEEERLEPNSFGDVGVDVDGGLPLAAAIGELVGPKFEALRAAVWKIWSGGIYIEIW